MGGVKSILFERFFGPKELRILILGLEDAGKTTILFKMKVGEVVLLVPTPGFSVDMLRYKNINIYSWDIGKQPRDRKLILPYYQDTNGLIFVVDSCNRDRIAEAQLELMKLLAEDTLKNTILLIFANKQDMENAMTIEEVTDKLGLRDLYDRKWFVQATSAVTKDGLYEGLDWLSQEIINT